MYEFTTRTNKWINDNKIIRKLDHYNNNFYLLPNNEVSYLKHTPENVIFYCNKIAKTGGRTFIHSVIDIENEIIKYESIGSGTLETVTRGQSSTLSIPHSTNTPVYKYEFNGVSLRRINTTHDISDTGLDIDSYYIEIDRTSNGVNRNSDNTPTGYPQLSFSSELTSGGSKVFASENIQYDAIIPFYDIGTPGAETSVLAKIRSVSGTSVSGNEVSFQDLGYEDIQINSLNTLSSSRIVASKVNEDTFLTSLPRNKSFTTAITIQ